MALKNTVLFVCMISCTLQLSYSKQAKSSDGYFDFFDFGTSATKGVAGSLIGGLGKVIDEEGTAIKDVTDGINSASSNILKTSDKYTKANLGKYGGIPGNLINSGINEAGKTVKTAGKIISDIGETQLGNEKETTTTTEKKSETVEVKSATANPVVGQDKPAVTTQVETDKTVSSVVEKSTTATVEGKDQPAATAPATPSVPTVST